MPAALASSDIANIGNATNANTANDFKPLKIEILRNMLISLNDKMDLIDKLARMINWTNGYA